jgi:hypothetical protein
MHEFCFYPLTSYQVMKLHMFWFPCLPKPLVTSPRLWLQHLDQQFKTFSAFPQKFTLFASTFAINHALSHHIIFSDLQFMSKEWKLSLLIFHLKLVMFCDNYDQILNYNQLPKNWQSFVISLFYPFLCQAKIYFVDISGYNLIPSKSACVSCNLKDCLIYKKV